MNTSENHKSTERVLTILELLSQTDSEHGLTLTEICKQLDAPKSSLFPIIHTMSSMGFLACEENTGNYSIGLKAYLVGNSFRNSEHLMKFYNSKMHEIVNACSETCQLGVLDSQRVLYIDKVDSPDPIRLVSDIGKSLPVYCTGMGKALICDLSLEELQQLLTDPLIPHTQHTVRSINELYEQIQEIKKTDIAYDRGEMIESTDCIAIPIRKKGKIISAISVSTPSYRFNEEKEMLIIDTLKQAKISIEEFLNS